MVSNYELLILSYSRGTYRSVRNAPLGFHEFRQWLGQTTNVTIQVCDGPINTVLTGCCLGLAASSRGILYEFGLAQYEPQQTSQPRRGIIHTIVNRVLVVDQLPVRVPIKVLMPLTDMALDLGNPTRAQDIQRHLDTGTRHKC